MKKNIITICALAFITVGFAQSMPGVGIGTKKPSKSAMLDISATDKGVLIPRLDLKDATTFLRDNEGSKVYNIGMLVYHNNTSNSATLIKGFYSWTGSNWDRITSESELTTVIDNLRTEISTEISNEIEKITIIPGGDPNKPEDMSSLVVYNPTTKTFSYLIKDGATYKQEKITFEQLVKGEETKTFIRPVTKNIDSKDITVGYVYFGEEAIQKWLEGNTTIDGITDDLGVTIDVVGTVSNNLETIITNNDSYLTEIINNVVTTEGGNVRIVTNDKGEVVLQYKPSGTEDYVDVDLRGLETITTLNRSEWDDVTNTFKIVPNTTAPIGALGKVFYAYEGEIDANGNRQTQYIDISEDFIYTIENNTDVKESIHNSITEYFNTNGGGNVFYGPMEKDGEDILYVITADGKKSPINITESVREVFETIIKDTISSKELIETIKEAIGVDLKEGVAVATGDKIGGNKVYRQVSSITVNEDEYGYNSDFEGTILVSEMGPLLNVTIYNVKGDVVVNTITDVTKTDSTLKFSFGNGSSYLPLDNGKYMVVFEYIAL